MARSTCQRCRVPISNQALACPRCAFPVGKSIKTARRYEWMGVIVLVAVIALMAVVLETPEKQSLPVGSKLYSHGELWGTVVGKSDAHTFENGVVEPGVLVDYGPRMGNPPVPPQWLPRRSAERFSVR